MEQESTKFYAVDAYEGVVDGQPVWTATHPELLGCTAVGASQDEAISRLEEAREAWIATARHLQREVPEATFDDPTIGVHFMTTPGSARTSSRDAGNEVESKRLPGKLQAA
jgi:predicted RNase H-like HicB family nuclease